MNLHFPLPKIRTIGDELTLSLAKIRTFRFSLHTFRLSLHGEVTIVALKFAMSLHFPLPKIFSPSLFPLFQMARAARRVIESTSLMLNSPLYQAADTFNALPAILQSASNLTSFKTVLHYSYSHANVHAVSTLVSR